VSTAGGADCGSTLSGVEALIVVDVQNDFCPGGALPVPEGDTVVEPINRMAAEVELVVATRDWHPADHGSFAEHGGRWPVHCVQDTPGAQLHSGLVRDHIDVVIDKGQDPTTDGYSGFDGTDLARLLRDRGVDRVRVAGLALDYCVKNTALDAVREGFETVVHRSATRAVNVNPGDDEAAVRDLEVAGVKVD
jgi:nicotinamidase/pyrazinamidase